jgi:membrane-associated phospholipid phosphatase
MNFFDTLIHWDRQFFYVLNGKATAPLLDTVMPFLREPIFWVPLYLFLLVFILMNFGLRGFYWILFLTCTAALCDMISSHVIKEFVYRLRPCREPMLEHPARLLAGYCGQNSSFTSSHAFNHFGAAVFIFRTLHPFIGRRWCSVFIAWAAIVAYAQVYVGVHYPADVLAGALGGSFIGSGMSVIFIKKAGLQFA